MELINYFLPAIIALGVITSYEDLKYGKIKNKYVISSLIYSLIVNIIVIIYIAFMGGWINYLYLVEWFTGIILAWQSRPVHIFFIKFKPTNKAGGRPGPAEYAIISISSIFILASSRDFLRISSATFS